MIISTLYGEEEVLSKVCNDCETEKPLSDFRVDTSVFTTLKHRPECKDCERKKRESLQRIHKNNTLEKPSVCACCGKVPKRWVLDHDHITMQIRGWVCDNCNLGLASLGDNKEGILKALAYFERYEERIREVVLGYCMNDVQ